jgi:thiol:disulfide interchange protein DsbD
MMQWLKNLPCRLRRHPLLLRGVFFLLFLTTLHATPAFQSPFSLMPNIAGNSINWVIIIPQGYEIYQEKITLTSSDKTLKINLQMPEGAFHNDAILGQYHTYDSDVSIQSTFSAKAAGTFPLSFSYQGCAISGYCYPPQTNTFLIALSKDAQGNISLVFSDTKNNPPPFLDKGLLLKMLSLFGLGILLCFTPCVLPVLPLLSAFIVRGKAQTLSRAFSIALTYVFSMALIYSLLGLFAGLGGHYLQSTLQSPWMLIIIGAFFAVFALSMFNMFDLRLPAFLQGLGEKGTGAMEGHPYVRAILLGALSVLIASPCMTAPLFGTLLYISQTGDGLLGFLLLLSLSLGMGLPLLLVATFGKQLLPKSGAWMNIVKYFFGILLLLMAAWFLVRGISATLHTEQTTAQNDRITSISSFHQALSQAKGQPVMVDVYADWCSNCVVMKYTLFKKQSVIDALKNVTVITVDVTQNNQSEQALLKSLQVFAPPTFIFYNREGLEVDRIVGEMSEKELQEKISHL